MVNLSRIVVVVLFLYVAGVLTFGGMQLLEQWADDVDMLDVATEVLEEGLAWPVTLLEWLDLI